VETFSDAVFAIAITLLVLEIKVVPAEFEHLRKALAHEWPQYLAYVTSFLTIGSVWVAHHNLYGRLPCIDAPMMRLNLLLLMWPQRFYLFPPVSSPKHCAQPTRLRGPPSVCTA
jgi:uncharacterized membrane protein